ncbi:MAG: MBL fold metallo-hydrolase [Clostridia bacterium]|nr:MBL fold metallo-hydrolase [Clostridia bacterium]
MKLTVLGKYGPYPFGQNTACSGYLIEDGDTKLLVDCGSGVLARLTDKININDLTAIYLTHLHFDHTSDLLPMGYLLDDFNKDVPVYTCLTGSQYEKILFTNKHFMPIHVDSSSNVNIGNLKLTFYEMMHPVINHGVLIECNVKLGITGDTKYCDNVLKLAKKSDYLLADCSKPKGFNGPHMGVEYATKLINETNTIIFATHVTPNTKSFINNSDNRIILVEELSTYNLIK